MSKTEYLLQDVTVLGGSKPIHEQLKDYLDDGWAVHSWQFKNNTNHQIAVLLTRNIWDTAPVEEKPARKFIGMKSKDAV